MTKPVTEHDYPLSYRADIDGLRALAIMLVVLFHAKLSIFSGGFIGVDVFFVISGFLITSILLKQITSNRFSILTFYNRRIRRIFPALFSTLIVTTIVGYFIMMPMEFKEVGKTLVATTGFSSNIFFWRNATNYFTTDDSINPLLHTWSIAVEEQFYIFFPLYLFLAFKWSRRYVLPLTVIFLIISFVLSLLILFLGKPIAAFFFLPPRAWELLIGAVLAFRYIPTLRHTLLKNILSLVGILLIIIPAILLTKNSVFPGYNALFPTIGAALLIYTASKETWITGILSFSPIVFLGKISYSLYLWHWPVFIFVEYYLMRPLSLWENMILILGCIIFSAFSWIFIEQPFRQTNKVYDKKVVFSSAAIVMLFTVSIGMYIYFQKGIAERLPQQAQQISVATKGLTNEVPYGFKDFKWANLKLGVMGGQTSTSFVVWGDSHANAFAPGIFKAAAQSQHSGLLVKHPACLPVFGLTTDEIEESCVEFNKTVTQKIINDDKIRTVILAARWHEYPLWISGETQKETPESRMHFRELVIETIQALHNHNKKIVIIAQIPYLTDKNIPSLLGRCSFFQRPCPIEIKTDRYLAENDFILGFLSEIQSLENVLVIYPHENLCDKNTCQLTREGHSLYYDDNHMSTFGAESISSIFLPIFDDK